MDTKYANGVIKVKRVVKGKPGSCQLYILSSDLQEVKFESKSRGLLVVVIVCLSVYFKCMLLCQVCACVCSLFMKNWIWMYAKLYCVKIHDQ